MRALRLAVIGHVQHVTMGSVPALPAAGDIVHLEAPHWFPGGGGGVAFFQLAQSAAELHLFTALGDDGLGDAVLARTIATGAQVHAVRRPQPHARDVTLLTPDGERTIIVVDEPLHPRADDPLPWDVLARCDAVFYTAYDPALIQRARAARLLVVTARRRASLIEAGVGADVVVGSGSDPRERGRRCDYPIPPGALVMTAGPRGGTVEQDDGEHHFDAAVPPAPPRSTYGAGDTFAAALTWFCATGLTPLEACRRAAVHAAAVLAGPTPLISQRPLPAPIAPPT
jgi:ribokinase